MINFLKNENEIKFVFFLRKPHAMKKNDFFLHTANIKTTKMHASIQFRTTSKTDLISGAYAITWYLPQITKMAKFKLHKNDHR